MLFDSQCCSRVAVNAKHRLDIDGLRALAVVPVVYFHSGLPGLKGGFTGVDTFFIISGFLISGILHREISAGEFTFANFYERRIRRIAPALIVVILVTLAAGSVLLLPAEYKLLGKSAMAALLMFPNMYFWRQAGYFAPENATTPLLHTWSLGVEEQFYLLFPIFLIILHRLRMVRAGLMFVTGASLLLCLVGTQFAPSLTFYALPTRAWELTLGAMLGIGVIGLPAPRFRAAASVLGLALLVIAATAMHEGDPFPGWRAIIPAVGAAMVISAGPNAVVNKWLSAPTPVYLGKISYSLYLWHWPCFALLRHYYASAELAPPVALLAIGMSLALAAASYHFIEQPARRGRLPYRRVVSGALVGAVAVSVLSVAIIGFAGFPTRFSSSVLALEEQKNDLAPLSHRCVNTPLDRIEEDCRIGKGPAKALIWGDSQAAAMSAGVASALNVTTEIASMNSCVPAISWTSPALVGRDPAICTKRNDALLSLALSDANLQTVVITASWTSHLQQGAEGMWPGVGALVDRLRTGGKRVIIIAGIPAPGFDVPWANALQSRFGRPQQDWACPPANIKSSVALVADLSSDYCAYPAPQRLFTDAVHPSLTANREVIGPALARMLKSSPLRPRGGNYPAANAVALGAKREPVQF